MVSWESLSSGVVVVLSGVVLVSVVSSVPPQAPRVSSIATAINRANNLVILFFIFVPSFLNLRISVFWLCAASP